MIDGLQEIVDCVSWRPVLNQMDGAGMEKCCQLQTLSPSNGDVPLDIVFLQFDLYS